MDFEKEAVDILRYRMSPGSRHNESDIDLFARELRRAYEAPKALRLSIGDIGAYDRIRLYAEVLQEKKR